MQWIVKTSLFLAAVIHLLPVTGVAGAERLAALYGVAIGDPSLLILMRHRALLFGMLGAFMLAALWLAHLRNSAFALGLFSVVSFLALALLGAPYNASIGRIVMADLLALALLLAGWAAHGRAIKRCGPF